ncbi:OapC/ArvC family zinc-ribbon domain-containing protein [Aeromonas allosaccharophila]|uniref:OapC/ArvC family zinc-ribbon domain-containing protein n=1 Tax=Aeromonas allosaccharophila TaxID=656 RepID=UPI00128ECAB5|nr:Zn-ribbon containing protein [Aeromonas allosaccharophila]EKP0302587.1 hypothetical protein [Aeromonas veronii]
MKLDKFDRGIRLHCPTCGCTDFSFVEHDDEERVTCTQCERQMARFELIQENAELMTETQHEIAKEAQKQLQAEMKKMLKNAFKGNKNIKFR